MNRSRWALLALYSLVFGTAYGSHDPCHVEQDTVIIFSNGILTTDTGSELAKEAIREELRERLADITFNSLAFDTVQNRTSNGFMDLYESLEQRITSTNVAVSFWRWLGGIGDTPNAVQEELTRIASRFDASEFVTYEDVDAHLQTYRRHISAGKKIVVACHSQANFSCNAEHNVLTNSAIGTSSFGLVSVANPASYVAGDGPHTTLVEDLIIKAVALSSIPTGTILPQFSNITNIGSGARGDHWSGHFFNENYMLENSRTVDKIIMDIMTVRDGLAQPPKEATGIPGAVCVCTGSNCTVEEPPPPIPEPVTPHCSDGIDNDGDGKTDWDGGLDSNGDGASDGIPDPGCTGPTDTNEFNILVIRG